MIYNDLPVLTTKKLAEGFGIGAKKILRTFSKQREEFIEGKHYFIVFGDNLVKIKQELKESKHASILYLWTEEGAYLIAKLMKEITLWEAYTQNIFPYYEANR